jgi:microcystin degradation protein MlrC
MIEVLPTSTQPMRGFADRMMALEGHSELSGLSEIAAHVPGDRKILSVSCIHGFMAADVECMGSAMLVVTDGEPEQAAALAEELGMELFELRGTTRPEYLHPQAGIDRAIAADKAGRKPAVIADVWDNPGGGAPGDGTVILQLLLDGQVDNVGYSGPPGALFAVRTAAPSTVRHKISLPPTPPCSGLGPDGHQAMRGRGHRRAAPAAVRSRRTPAPSPPGSIVLSHILLL